MEAGRRSINDIFNGNRKLEIPFFQRSYVWKTPQWERFLEDMEFVTETNQPYFLGSLILKQKDTRTDKSVGDIRTIVDGQQRLTTLNIFMKLIALLSNNNKRFKHDFQLFNGDYAILHNYNDADDFVNILSLEKPLDLPENCQINKAYMYFKKNIKPEKVSYQSIMNNVFFVGIDITKDEDEQQIFDTINSIGVRLTTAELLKNYFFVGENDYQSYIDNWRNIFEKDKDIRKYWDRELTTGRLRRNNIDLFFYSFLQIKLNDPSLTLSTIEKQRLRKVEGLFDSYKYLISKHNINKANLIFEIKEYAKIYQKYIDYDVVDRELDSNFGIDRINAIIFGLETTTLLPYVLFVLHEVCDIHKKNELLKYLESYILRRMICHNTTKNYNRLFSEQLIANRILDIESFKEFINKKSDKVDSMPDNDSVLNGFHNSVLTNKQSRGVLYMLESLIRNRSLHASSLLGLNRYSLEHIMPKKWENHWGHLSSEEKRINRNKKLLTFGNLTILPTSLNISVRDADWINKRDGVKDKRGLKHYAAGLDTMAPYLSLDRWDESTIEKRANDLYEKALNVWS